MVSLVRNFDCKGGQFDLLRSRVVVFIIVHEFEGFLLFGEVSEDGRFCGLFTAVMGVLRFIRIAVIIIVVMTRFLNCSKLFKPL